MVQWLRLQASNAAGVGSIPERGNKMLCGVAKKKKDGGEDENIFLNNVLFFFNCSVIF